MITNLKFTVVLPALCLIVLSGTQIYAGFRLVTTLEDTNDGVCDAQCSLREGVAAANDGDTIIFDRSLRGGTIQLQETLVIEKTLKIDGPNRRRITLRGNGTFRILYIGSLYPTGPSKQVWLDGLIVRDGNATYGGGIYVRDYRTLTVTDSVITENRAAFGGGIRISTAYLYLINSTVYKNVSDGSGGTAGIDAAYAPALHVVNSTIAGNTAQDGAGGIKSDPEQLEMLNSTVSGNFSLGTGFGRVGGIFTEHTGSSHISNSIVAGNTGETPDVFLSSSSGVNNLIGVGEGSRFSNGIGGNIVGTRAAPANPWLGQLSDNGRGLPTFAPLLVSPVIGAGEYGRIKLYEAFQYPFYSSATDQRGFQRLTGEQVDMGAVEYGGSPVLPTTTISGRVMSGSRGVSRAVVSIRDASGEVRWAVTNPFGYYRIDGLAGDTEFTIEVRSKLYNYQAQSLTTEETVEYVDFVAS